MILSTFFMKKVDSPQGWGHSSRDQQESDAAGPYQVVKLD